MAPSSLTLQFEALLSTTLFKWAKSLEDQISTANAFYYMLKKKGGYQTVSDIGERMAMPLMYGLANTDSFSGYDVIPTDPVDGLTTAFYDWRQSATAITISGKEEKQNAGEERIISLLEAKTQQAKTSIVTFFNQKLQQGNGGSAITTAYTSGQNGSLFIDPLPLQIAYDPTASIAIGNINQNTNSWWRNQTTNSTSTTFAGFFKELRKTNNNCSKGGGGFPNLHLCDQATAEFYEAALASMHRNPSYAKADLPFASVAFEGNPLCWDEYVPDVQGGSVTQSSTSGSWWMINTDYWGVRVQADSNFSVSPFRTPIDQDCKTARILWMGAVGCSNRRKNGVVGGIDTTITS